MRREYLRRKYRRLQHLYRERGVRGMILQAARQLLTALYHRDVQYVFVRRLDGQDQHGSPREGKEDKGTDCLLVESPHTLQAVAEEIPVTRATAAIPP
ncbi:MAG TPA: hypothetical protein VGX03_10475 [Candidatus Binatia bacterium]|nr:hypothetical protein [Candidatus Binatia bacterium]